MNCRIDCFIRINEKRYSSLFSGSIIGIFGSVIFNVLKFLTNIILARYLGAGVYGIYSIVNSINTIGQKFGALGLPQGIVKFVGESIHGDKKHTVIDIFVTTLLINIVIIAVVGLFFTFYPELIAVNIYSNSALVELLKISAFLIPVNIMVLSFTSYLLAMKRIDLKISVEKVLVPVVNIVAVLLVILSSGEILDIYQSILIANGFALLISILLLKTAGLPIFDNKIKKLIPGPILIYSIPTFLTGMSYIIMNRLDVLMLGYFVESDIVGIYNISSRTSEIMVFFIGSMMTFFAPVIVELYAKKNLNKLSKYFELLSKWIITLTTPVFIVIIIFSKDLLSIVGEAYIAGFLVLLILSFGQLINAATGPVGLVLKMTSYQNIDMFNGLIMLVSNTILNLILIPKYGMNGAATATVVSLIGIHLLRLVEVTYFLKLKLNFKWLGEIFLLILLISTPSYYLFYINEYNFLIKCITFLIILALYFFVVYNRLSELEFRYFSTIIHKSKNKFYRQLK